MINMIENYILIIVITEILNYRVSSVKSQVQPSPTHKPNKNRLIRLAPAKPN